MATTLNDKLPTSRQLGERASAMDGCGDGVRPASEAAELSAAEHMPAWHVSEGMRLQRVRALLLRLLRPQTDRQQRVDEALLMAVQTLGADVEELRERIQALETASEGREPR